LCPFASVAGRLCGFVSDFWLFAGNAAFLLNMFRDAVLQIRLVDRGLQEISHFGHSENKWRFLSKMLAYLSKCA
jgi:hypothetical protein